MTLAEACSVIRDWAAKKTDIRRVWVFGSRVGGTAKVDSDIDIAVETFGGDKGVLHWPKVHKIWLDELGSQLPWLVQLVWYDPEGSTPTVEEGLEGPSQLIFDRTETQD